DSPAGRDRGPGGGDVQGEGGRDTAPGHQEDAQGVVGGEGTSWAGDAQEGPLAEGQGEEEAGSAEGCRDDGPGEHPPGPLRVLGLANQGAVDREGRGPRPDRPALRSGLVALLEGLGGS